MSVPKVSPRGALCALCALGVLAPVPPAAAQPARPTTALALDRMSRAAGEEVFTAIAGTGLVRFLAAAPGAPIALGRSGSAEERARAFLAAYGEAFGTVAPGVELATLRVSAPDEVGMEHVRFRQTYRGVPVTGGELTVHLRADGGHDLVLAELPGDAPRGRAPPVSTTPTGSTTPERPTTTAAT